MPFRPKKKCMHGLPFQKIACYQKKIFSDFSSVCDKILNIYDESERLLGLRSNKICCQKIEIVGVENGTGFNFILFTDGSLSISTAQLEALSLC